MTDNDDPTMRESDPIIHPRRELFEHGLLPIPKLIFSDGNQTLTSIKDKFLHLSASSSTHRVDSIAISETLQISLDHARLLLDTLASVLHCDSDPLVTADSSEVDSVGADVYHLLLFLYIQSYKRLLPRTHKDSAAIADVWPSTSAFDGYLSVLSPLQLARSNSRRFMPSQADEEAHQLCYIQKHLANILSLLANSVDGEGEESQVLTKENFEYIGFLIYFGDKSSDRIPLSQAVPFFANSDPDMPAAPVPATQIHEWLLQNIEYTTERISEKVSPKENGLTHDQDLAMVDMSAKSANITTNAKGPCVVEGISKSSYVRRASDIKGSYVKVANCQDSVIYILAPLRYATIYGCSDTTIVLGAVGKALRVEHCERVHVIVAAKRVCIGNCRECIFFMGVNQRPLMVGDNHKLQVAPFNTFYSRLEEHMDEVGVKATVNKWDDHVALGPVDPHDSLSHPVGISDVQAESASHLEPDQFTNFLIPNGLDGETSGSTEVNPFALPTAYMSSQQRNCDNLAEIKHMLKETQLEESRKRELLSALHVYFKDWLYGKYYRVLHYTKQRSLALFYLVLKSVSFLQQRLETLDNFIA
ncbi:TBCC domain-containing protein 1-like [Impatiens glandulifera]|uniref:TBCC domain-containing protein 1-like n=1 Tax=Impatiens glandulifera TaxID=253017 RepID=UPI001FB06CA1|nr:TBCC domain-containing protein 1-like [Impatiens glandulifera]